MKKTPQARPRLHSMEVRRVPLADGREAEIEATVESSQAGVGMRITLDIEEPVPPEPGRITTTPTPEGG